MQTEVERTFRNLKVISSLRQNDKLTTEHLLFTTHEPTMTRSAYRIWYRENRESNIDKVQSCVRDAKMFIERVISYDETTETFGGRLQSETQLSLCKRMFHAVQEVVPGLHNLSVTYKDDTGILAKIEILINEIEDFVRVSKRLADEKGFDLSIST